MKIPLSWQCTRHGLPIECGCIDCDRIHAVLRKIVTGKQAVLAVEVVLMYRAHDLLHTVEGSSEFRRASRQFRHAARRFATLSPREAAP